MLNNWAVAEVLARYAHVVDNREWGELSSVFTPDATVEAEKSLIVGFDSIRSYLETFDPRRSHHTLNTITDIDGDVARVWSRFIVVEFDATSLTGDYVDQVVATADGARIARRRITVRNRPDVPSARRNRSRAGLGRDNGSSRRFRHCGRDLGRSCPLCSGEPGYMALCHRRLRSRSASIPQGTGRNTGIDCAAGRLTRRRLPRHCWTNRPRSRKTPASHGSRGFKAFPSRRRCTVPR